MAHPIQHLVVLMMENRSFDHMLGFLPSTPENPINGLTGTETNPLGPEGPIVQVSRNARTVHDLIPDPGHEWVHVNKQISGNREGAGAPTMQGFVEDYADVANSHQGPNVMKCFTPQTLPILSTLATQSPFATGGSPPFQDRPSPIGSSPMEPPRTVRSPRT